MKHKVIGVCLSRIFLENQTNTIKILSKHARRNNCKLLLFNTFACLKNCPDSPERKIFDIINFDVLDGLIVFPDYIRNDDIVGELVAKAHAHNIPVLSINSKLNDCYNLLFDFASSFKLLVEHIVVKHKCKKINFIAAEKGNSFSEERLQVFKDVLAENDLCFDESCVFYGDFEEKLTYKLIDEMLASSDMPEAIICANDEMALAACDRLFENGLKVPDDIIVTGFDGSDNEKYHTPRLTTCIVDWDEIGAKAIGIFTSLFNNQQPPLTTIISYSFKTSQSCGCSPMCITDANYRTHESIKFRKRQIAFNGKLFEHAHAVSESKSFKEYFKKLENDMVLIKCKSFRLCLLDGFVLKRLSEKVLFEENTRDYSKITPLMMAAFNWKDGKTVPPAVFLQSELLPDIEDILGSEDEFSICFFPVTFQNKYIGYAAIEFNMNTVDFTNIFAYMVNFNNCIEIIKSNNDMNLAINMLKNMYSCDQMTELYNRRGFYNTIKDVVRKSEDDDSLIIFSIDMDGMKYINDNFGHHEGDNAIKALARGISVSGERFNVIGARFGGDEFVAAMLSKEPAKTITSFYDSLMSYLSEYNKNSENEYSVQASIGYMYTPLNASKTIDIDACIRKSDAVMYNDKKSKKCRSANR